MNRVEEIETAIDGLSSEDHRRIVEWVLARERENWDGQIDRDSAAGRLDFLFEEAERETVQGLIREWPQRNSKSVANQRLGELLPAFCELKLLTRTRPVFVRAAATGPCFAGRFRMSGSTSASA